MNKYYVYIYFDPRKRVEKNYCLDYSFVYEPFYVGKGSGSRAFAHLKQAYNFKDFKIRCNKEKCDLIRQIKTATSLDPKIEIIKYFDTQEQAYDYEKKLIQSIGRKHLEEGPLLNKTLDWQTFNNDKNNAKIRKGKANGMYGLKGKLSPNYGKPGVYQTWVKNYGKEIADIKEKVRRQKMSQKAKEFLKSNKHPRLGKKHSLETIDKIKLRIKQSKGRNGFNNPRYKPLSDTQYYIVITNYLNNISINKISLLSGISRKSVKFILNHLLS